MSALTNHSDYILRYGLLRWVLRECVRANPFYVISAALLAYGVLLLNTDIDPQVGQVGAIIVALALLHVYEIATLIAATVVMKIRNGSGGRDMHGLTMVAAIFLGGSFLALDELIAIWPWLGFVLVPAGLLLAALKLAWYARVPGIFLPPRYRYTALTVLGAHSISPLLGHPEVVLALGSSTAQSLAWLAGWVSILSVIHLVWLERHVIELRTKVPGDVEVDVLQTRWCGGWAVFIATGMGCLHLIGSDWVFDRPLNAWYAIPAVTMALGALMLRGWYSGMRPHGSALLMFGAPALAAHWLCWKKFPSLAAVDAQLLLGPVAQSLAAGLLFYLTLAWATGHKGFYAGVVAVLSAPSIAAVWLARVAVPHFKALASALLGFILLAGGMVISIYRDRLLKWLDPHVPSREDDTTTGPALLPES